MSPACFKNQIRHRGVSEKLETQKNNRFSGFKFLIGYGENKQ